MKERQEGDGGTIQMSVVVVPVVVQLLDGHIGKFPHRERSRWPRLQPRPDASKQFEAARHAEVPPQVLCRRVQPNLAHPISKRSLQDVDAERQPPLQAAASLAPPAMNTAVQFLRHKDEVTMPRGHPPVLGNWASNSFSVN